MTDAEWEASDDPLKMLDAIEETAQPQGMRRFAVICCESLLPMLGDEGRWAIEVASRLARGEATESDRAKAEFTVFRYGDYLLDDDRRFEKDWYEAAGYGPYQVDSAYAASEAASGAVGADAWMGARVTAASVLEAVGEEKRPSERLRLCKALRSIMRKNKEA